MRDTMVGRFLCATSEASWGRLALYGRLLARSRGRTKNAGLWAAGSNSQSTA